MEIKTFEKYVIKVLQVNKRARTDDFILYGAVLRRIGVSLDTTLRSFLANAKLDKMPSFETITRCRRHLQQKHPELQDKETTEARAEKIKDFKNYNKSA